MILWCIYIQCIYVEHVCECLPNVILLDKINNVGNNKRLKNMYVPQFARSKFYIYSNYITVLTRSH